MTARMIEDRKEIDEILAKAVVGRLGTSLRDRPYVVPINFVYYQGKIYFHSALKGLIVSYMKANNQVCFEVDESELVPDANPCNFTFRYRSVVAFGKVRYLEDLREKHAVLSTMLQKYDKEKAAVSQIPEESLKDVAVWEMTLESVTGKKNEVL